MGSKPSELPHADPARLLREILDALPAPLYTTDAEGRLTHFNPAAAEFSGRTPELGTDRWCVTWKLFRPDGTPLPHRECPMAVALREGRAAGGTELIAERPDGTRRWFIPYARPLHDATGRITGGVNLLVDVGERRQRGEELKLLAAIVDSSDDAIYSKNVDGVITSWNQGAERLFGYAAQEAVGRQIHLIVPSDRFEEEASILKRIRRGERIDRFETVRRKKDGELLDMSVTISPIRDAAGRVIGASTVARDFTGYKRAEEALRRSEGRYRAVAESLDSEVRRRTRELEERTADVVRQSELAGDLSRRLMDAQEEERRHIARELHDSAGQLLAGLGMNLEAMADEAAETAPHLSEAVAKARELTHQLTQEIRTMSYLLHPPLLEESGLPAALGWYVHGLAERSGLELALDVSQPFERLPREVELVVFRVVQECLTNVHRHSGSRSARIQLARDPAGVRVRVQDQGRGIPAEKLAELQSAGSGLGIRGARERARHLGGELRIDSGPGGTSVFVTIPLSGSGAPAEPKRAETRTPSGRSRGRGAGGGSSGAT